MIDEARLLDGLVRLLTATEDNIRQRCNDEPTVNQPLQERYEAARKTGRTGVTFTVWREAEITQAAVAWLLACVFVRFLEDNDLLSEVYLAGPNGRTKSAQERQRLWYREHPLLIDRDYLLDIFSELVRLPGMKGLLDRDHNPLWSLGPDGDGAKAILDFFQSADHDTGVLLYDFTDTVRGTRFLGDLYQNISESARKRYALLQTPDFIVDFILDRTLTPALDEFGLEGFRLIDPACGSGHFLLEAFDRLFHRWVRQDGDLTVVVRNALDCVYGVDLNPYAAAIARFRLLIAAMQACGITRLSNAPDWQIHITIGDSLLFGPNGLSPSLCTSLSEDSVHIDHLLRRQTYSVVVGNPPYITVQDAELRKKYRGLYRSCARAYQVSVPFTELFFDLADKSRPGYVGMIVSNGFMKRSFGKPLIERLLPKWDMTHVMDTAGVYLPGHGTATAILIGRNRHPIRQTVRVVRGIRGEREAPNDPANAPVWREICEQLDNPGYHGRYVSIADAERETFHRHPWSIGGGGAAELKLRLDEGSAQRVKQAIADAGFGAVTREYELFSAGDAARRHGVNPVQIRTLIDGAHLRDWSLQAQPSAIWPYAGLDDKTGLEKFLWPWRAQLRGRTAYGISQLERGQPWYEYSMYFSNRYLNPISLVCAEIATHNHFVLDRGAKVFNCTALLIKLAPTATELDHIGLAGILNSSVACFWLRQVCFPKRGDGIGRGIATETWEFRFDFAFAKLFELPLPTGRTETIASAIQSDADQRSAILPAALVTREVPTRASVTDARDRAEALRVRMIALQEELDWHVYHLYGLLEESLTLPIDQVPPVHLGERAFEILMARAMESGELQTEWFARHGSTPRTTIPEHWPKPYRALVQRRLDTITSDRDIALIEQPEYKRRWNLPPWEELEQEALRNWLLDRLEDSRYWPTNPPVLTSVARLADAVRHDAEFRQVAELYRNRADFDLTELIEELAAKESVPFLPVLRYKEPGLRKRADWEGTWQLQRREDAGEKVEIPVPPKYEKDDFLSGDYWRLRGKLDVPKERFISYSPLARDADKSLVLSWAGYDHGQQALALAGYYYEMRAMEAWDAARLTPILAGLQELQPWLDQWHNEIDPERQQRLNKFIRGFFEGELAQLSLTAEQVRAWRPSAQAARAGRRKKR